MAGFNLYSSNCQERLVARLAQLLREQPLAAALAPETILVQNYGMQRWVALELARINGIEANTRFIFPNELLQMAFSIVVPGCPAAGPPTREELGWAIMAVLPPLLGLAEFASLRRYLEGARPLKLFQLAGRLASLFDQYAMYRPEMLLAWEKKATGGDWQALLWQALPHDLRQRQRPAMRRAFFENLDAVLSGGHRLHLPERISIFGLSSLPPLHVEVLAGLARAIDLHLFFLSPSDQYWGDLLSDREVLRKTHRLRGLAGRDHSQAGALTAEDLYLESGNPLLASLGRYGQEFFHLLLNRDLIDGPDETDFAPPSGDSLLHRLQRDIFLLADPTQDLQGKTKLSPTDRSLQIHSCHSPMREVEVLHDQLLHLLDTIPGLKPSDIVVMTPDIETYAPLIQSVFSTASAGAERFPFSIADRGMRRESRVIRYFLGLLAMTESRFSVTEVFEFLESGPLRAHFELTAAEVDTVRQMVVRANVRWGIDADFRRRLGLPATHETTWQFGIERLLIGYGLPAGERQLFGPVLPFDDIEGTRAAAFGRFLAFFERLRELVEPGPLSFGRSRSLPAWAEFLEGLLSRFFLEDEAAALEFGLLRSVFAELRGASASDLEMAVEVIAAHLQGRLEALSGRGGFLGLGVTFCSMMPMRAIPFEVIALLGMNDSAFPRLDRPLSFDLLQKERRLGDRSLKDEDRYLFLETILSSRQVLYISFVGQSSKDNAILPPSTLVTELLDYIEQGWEAEQGTVHEQLLTRHPLQPFSSRYFQQDGRLFSYSGENLAAARQLQQTMSPGRPPLFTARLAGPGPEFSEVSIETLASFFSNPARFLLNERLGVRLHEEQEPSPDEETFSLDSLARYSLQTRLLELALTPGAEPASAKQLFSASGSLPLSQAGDLVFTAVQEELADFCDKLAGILGQQRPALLPYDFSFAGCQFRGVIPCLYPPGLIRFRPAPVKTRDRLQVRLEQLILSFLQQPGGPPAAVLIGLDKESGQAEVFQLEPVTDPEPELRRLLSYYQEGLCRPLAFFPRSAQAYMDALFDKDGDRDLARKKANLVWLGSEFKPGEMAGSPYFLRCFQEVDLFSETDFEQIVLDLLLPVYEAQERRC